MACSLAPIAFAGCEGEPSPQRAEEIGGPAAERAFGKEAIAEGTALGEVEGHLVTARELYEQEDRRAALEHAEHSIEEFETTIVGELASRGADVGAVSTAVSTAITVIESDESPEEVATAVSEVAHAVDEAIAQFVEGAIEPEVFRGSIVIGLVEAAAAEYATALGLEGDTVQLLRPYEDAYGFTDVARSFYGDIKHVVIEGSPEKALRIQEDLGVLERAMPSIAPPDQPVDVAEVEAAAEEIERLLQETIDAAAPERDAAEVLTELRSLLDDVLQLYSNEEAEAAREAALEAYLRDYKPVETDIGQQAPEISTRLGTLLSSDLPRAIEAEAPEAVISRLVDRGKRLIDRALETIAGP